MTPSLPRLMAQLNLDPPIELWRRSAQCPELSDEGFNILTENMSPESGWRSWWVKPLRDAEALGNSMAVPCMAWIGRGIETVEGIPT